MHLEITSKELCGPLLAERVSGSLRGFLCFLGVCCREANLVPDLREKSRSLSREPPQHRQRTVSRAHARILCVLIRFSQSRRDVASDFLRVDGKNFKRVDMGCVLEGLLKRD